MDGMAGRIVVGLPKPSSDKLDKFLSFSENTEELLVWSNFPQQPSFGLADLGKSALTSLFSSSALFSLCSEALVAYFTGVEKASLLVL